MPGDTQTISRTRPLEVLRRLPISPLGFVAGLSGEEVQALANDLGIWVSTTLPNGNFLALEPEEEDDPDRLDLGPAN